MRETCGGCEDWWKGVGFARCHDWRIGCGRRALQSTPLFTADRLFFAHECTHKLHTAALVPRICLAQLSCTRTQIHCVS